MDSRAGKNAQEICFQSMDGSPSVLAESEVELDSNYPGPCVDHSEARARALAALATLKQT